MEAHVGECSFTKVFFCFWHTFVMLCELIVIPSMSPFSRMTQGSVSKHVNADWYCLLSGWWKQRWMVSSGSSPASPLGLHPSSYQLWLWTHCLLAQWEALIAVPEAEAGPKPDATTNPTLTSVFTSLEEGCHQKEETRSPRRCGQKCIFLCLLKHIQTGRATHTLNRWLWLLCGCSVVARW